MTQDRWKEVLATVKEKFGIEEEYHEELEDVPGSDVHVVIFNGTTGKIKLEYEVKPVVLSRKTIYSKLAGTAQAVEYTYSDSEMTSRLTVFAEDNGDWTEIKNSTFA